MFSLKNSLFLVQNINLTLFGAADSCRSCGEASDGAYIISPTPSQGLKRPARAALAV